MVQNTNGRRTEVVECEIFGRQKEEEGYVTIDGQEHISDKIHNLLAHVEERVYCSCSGVLSGTD